MRAGPELILYVVAAIVFAWWLGELAAMVRLWRK